MPGPPDGAAAIPSGGFARAFSSLLNPQFRLLWFGTLFSMAAMQMNIIARPWLAYEISGSGVALGVVSLARGLPMLVLSPVGGVAADRFSKRQTLLITQASLGVIAVINAVLIFSGLIEVWHLVVLGLVEGAIFPFNMPARQAFIPELVEQDRLANALAMQSTGMNLNRVLSPTVAGVLLAVDASLAFAAVALMYVGAVFMLLQLPPGRGAMGRGRGTLGEILVGLRYIRTSPVLLTLIGMAFIPVLLGMPYQQLLPVFQQDVLQIGPGRLGTLYTAAGVGSLAGSLIIAYFSEFPRKGLLQLVSGIGFGVSLALFALSTSYPLSLALLALVGLTGQGYMTVNSVLIMLNTDRELYGRVMSVYMMTWSLMPVAMLPMGALVDTVGVQATVAGAGALLALFIAVAAVVHPAHRKMETPGASPGPLFPPHAPP
ncbi:MAG TPA: MFS transporter [Dehalococcoidia bacterium]